MSSLLLTRRDLKPEVMDEPGLEATEHRRALRGLRRLNLASGVAGQLWREIARRLDPPRGSRLRVLDVASGGGDVALGLWKRARRGGVELEILGLDASAVACAFAAEKCLQVAGASGSICFQQRDVTQGTLPAGFDVVTCSLFLHHLTSKQATALLQSMAAAGRLMLVSDLRRGPAGYALAQAACRLLTMSRVVHVDGPRSVANAFSVTEMRQLCDAAGLADASIAPSWPYRLMISRMRSDGHG